MPDRGQAALSMRASRSTSLSPKARIRMAIAMPPANPLPTRTCQVRKSRRALTGRTTRRGRRLINRWERAA